MGNDFCVDFTVSLTAASLDTKMEVRNTGDKAWDFQAALHSYFDVSSLKNIEVAGSFAGATYLDKMLDPPSDQTEAREALTISEEYDRVYKGVNDCTLKDSGKGMPSRSTTARAGRIPWCGAPTATRAWASTRSSASRAPRSTRRRSRAARRGSASSRSCPGGSKLIVRQK